jgi:C4-dicarboxylate-specific signal transduction histidine kinase
VTRVASLGELTASIAHEVNQPLTGIIANANAALRWLARQPPEVGEATDAIQRLARDGKRAGEVVGRLSSLIRQGERTRKSSLDLNQVVRETLPLVRSEVQQNEVSMTVELSPQAPHVLADRVQIQQVLLNLIINALEAMSVVNGRPRELRIASRTRGADAVIAIEDTGVGMRPEQQGLIFDAFFTTKEQGMGMGLAISRSIVEDHGGHLSVTSVPGSGSTFEFNLPAAKLER